MQGLACKALNVLDFVIKASQQIESRDKDEY
jgi:hypothetical protein